MNVQMLLAGFGGQGILFMGKVAAATAMIDGKYVSWLPSYGPEMRGGTANCSVCIDKREIGCPIVLSPNLFVAFNRPSFEKFVGAVQPGGMVLADSSLIDLPCLREDVHFFPIPATTMAQQNNLHGLANMVMLGYLTKVSGFTSLSTLQQALQDSVPASKLQMLEKNLQAISLGYDFAGKGEISEVL